MNTPRNKTWKKRFKNRKFRRIVNRTDMVDTGEKVPSRLVGGSGYGCGLTDTDFPKERLETDGI